MQGKINPAIVKHLSSRKMFHGYINELFYPKVQLLRKFRSSFQICGGMGLGLALLLAITLTYQLELSIAITLSLCPTGVFISLGLIMATKVVTGEEYLVYYHHLVTMISVSATLLWLLHQPILPYLDLVILGLGLFQACGRIGCLTVGCCYGRPNPWGIRYRKEHANAGFPAYLVGVKLLPIQLIESLWGFFTVLVGSILILSKQPSGEALAWYILSYGTTRFCFEFWRGDPDRPYLWGFSEAQWTSFLLISVVAWAESHKVLPFHWWHIIVFIAVILVAVAVTLKRRLQCADEYHLLHPKHIQEVAEALELISNLTISSSPLSNIHIACTSLGIQISASRIKNSKGHIDHYTFSSEKESLTEAKAHIIARLILKLKQVYSSVELIERNEGIFHLIIPDFQNSESSPIITNV
jgi:hypothetical protein